LVTAAKAAIKSSLENSEITILMDKMFAAQANRCWNYYFKTVQQGILCSFCQDDTDNFYFDIPNTKIQFTFKSCDMFIPNCLKTAVILKRL
jgi:hypothetical protein